VHGLLSRSTLARGGSQALQKTYSANKMQEETLKDLQLQLKELAPLHEAGDQLEVETAKSSFLLEDKNQAEMTAAMCRQEAAAAVQEKENQIWQHQQALERAREDVDELQRVVKEREGVLYQREMKLVATAHDMRGKLQSTSERLNDREKSIHWLAERKRLDNEQHTYAPIPYGWRIAVTPWPGDADGQTECTFYTVDVCRRKPPPIPDGFLSKGPGERTSCFLRGT
jgi:hypothetical protein